MASAPTRSAAGKPFGKFWDGLVYKRVLTSSLEELGLKVYFEGNHIQRELGYRERVRYLKRWNEYLYRLKATRAARLKMKSNRVARVETSAKILKMTRAPSPDASLSVKTARIKNSD